MTRSFIAGAKGATTTINQAAQAADAAARGKPSAGKRGATRKKGRAPARAYKEGSGWCLRLRYKGHDIYVSGQRSDAAARKAARERCTDIDARKLPLRGGPEANTVAQALQDYALDCLPFKKGAVQEARRINTYLRAAGLQTLVLTLWDERADAAQGAADAQQEDKDEVPATVYFEVRLEPWTEERKIPQGLGRHREKLLAKTARTEQHRAALATKVVSEVTRHELQGLINAMRRDCIAPATIWLERSMFRVLFNHAFVDWNWAALQDNPATMLKMPKVNNVRKRTFSDKEMAALDEALGECRNGVAAATIGLLGELGMRATEPLKNVTWGDVDWERGVLRLKDDKGGGGREVALTADAIRILRELGPGEATESLLKISYEAIKAAMKRACERAGISDARLHDLRRTAATRAARISGGNVFMVQLRTGHKTLAMAQRYVQLTADDLRRLELEYEAQQAMLAQNASTDGKRHPTETEGRTAIVLPFKRRAA